MKKYTVAVHVQRIERMLLKKDPCGCCPASPRFDGYGDPWEMWDADARPCQICTTFTGMKSGLICPCHYHGPEEALRITREKLNEYYREVEG